jgi:hypothetical protein
MHLKKLCEDCPHWKYKMQEDKAGAPISMERYCPRRENSAALFKIEITDTMSAATTLVGDIRIHSRRITCRASQRYVDVHGGLE